MIGCRREIRTKGEVERMWPLFTILLMAGAFLLLSSTRTPLLAAPALTALAVNHVLFTPGERPRPRAADRGPASARPGRR